MNYKYKKSQRLLSKADFDFVKDQNQRIYLNHLIIFYKKNTSTKNLRLGLAISKKIGNAVIRNKVKRVLRETFRKIYPDLAKVNFDLVVALNLKRLGNNLNADKTFFTSLREEIKLALLQISQ